MTVKPSLFDTGIRPLIDAHLAKLAAEKRDYGECWSASSAGYCMRKNIFERLKIPYVSEDARKQRIFSAGDVFHEWIQRITQDAGLSIAQELELQDEHFMIRGHIDDLILKDGKLLLYDYKSAHSRSFHYAKTRPVSYFHKMQVGTYMYMLRKDWPAYVGQHRSVLGMKLEEARILKISKDDLCMMEHQVLYTPELLKEIVAYWEKLNWYWEHQKMPPCTCADREGGFMAKPLYNPYYYAGQPCSMKWLKLKMKEKNGK